MNAILLAGDRYHVAEDAFAGITPALEAAGLTVHCTTDFTSIDAQALKETKLLAILRDGMEWPMGVTGAYKVWMQADQETAIESFVTQGGAFLPLHNAGWAYPWRGGYRRVMGGYYQGHPAVAPFSVEVVEPNHPITTGVTNFEIEDEQHFLWFDYERVNLLLKSKGRDGKEAPAGWAYEFGNGRVAYLANGHTLEILKHEMVQRLLHNAARWLVRQI